MCRIAVKSIFYSATFPAAVEHTVGLLLVLLACRSDGGRFPERTFEAIRKRLERCSFVATRQ